VGIGERDPGPIRCAEGVAEGDRLAGDEDRGAFQRHRCESSGAFQPASIPQDHPRRRGDHTVGEGVDRCPAGGVVEVCLGQQAEREFLSDIVLVAAAKAGVATELSGFGTDQNTGVTRKNRPL
jgi:hypothetical protein